MKQHALDGHHTPEANKKITASPALDGLHAISISPVLAARHRLTVASWVSQVMCN